MAAPGESSETKALGHVALYARSGPWRTAMVKELERAGHSHREAAEPADIRELLRRQRFDVLILKIRDEQDATETTRALEEVPLPAHRILVGRVSIPASILQGRPRGSFLYVPGRLAAPELSRLVGASIGAGAWEESTREDKRDTSVEEVDLREAIEKAATAVYAQARGRRQSFSIWVQGPSASAMVNPARLDRITRILLRVILELAPPRAVVSVEARGENGEWMVMVRASAARRPSKDSDQLSEVLGHIAPILTSASRDVREEGGTLWVELRGPQSPAVCFTLRRSRKVRWSGFEDSRDMEPKELATTEHH